MNSSRQCRVCGEEGHLSVKCKELYSPPDGELYTGAGCGADDHDHDDETLDYNSFLSVILFTTCSLIS